MRPNRQQPKDHLVKAEALSVGLDGIPNRAEAFSRDPGGIALLDPMVIRAACLIGSLADEQTSGGNCGAFAIALARVLGRGECEYAISSAQWNMDQPMFGHVGLRYRGTILDGTGILPAPDLLNVWAEDDDENAEVRFVSANEDCEAWLLQGTDYEISPEAFEEKLRANAGNGDADRQPDPIYSMDMEAVPPAMERDGHDVTGSRNLG
jgi:hypothetical protein